MKVFLGIPAADGMGVGKAFVIPETVKRIIPQRRILAEEHSEGWARFQHSIKAVSEQINTQLEHLVEDITTNKIQKDLLDTYLLMLNDSVFLDELKSAYEEGDNNIEFVVDLKTCEYAEKLRNIGDTFLAERSKDITDVFNLVLDNMLSIHQFDINDVPDNSVIVATTLSPTDTIILSKRNISALVLTEGGASSHVVILARNYGIPTVVGINNITRQIQSGDFVIVNGKTAEVIVNPEEKIIEEYKSKISAEKLHFEKLKVFLTKSAVSKDGVSFNLYANIGTPEEAENALNEGSCGIGLFRTEFLYMSTVSNGAKCSFDEETQFNAYKYVLSVMKDKSVTIRTLDAGGDKLIHSSEIPVSDEKNPLMGLRAVRLSLAYPQIMKMQMRALYRASVYGNLRIMLPLITSVEQVEQCKAIAKSVRDELRENNIAFNENVPIGIMIETAAAALTSDILAKHCDFFSIGTNDLTQYTLGVDRENQSVSRLYDEFNLAVLRLIYKTIESAKKANISVSVCGEMAGRSDSVSVLAGMGLRDFSMSAKSISSIKELLSRFTVDEFNAISAKYLGAV